MKAYCSKDMKRLNYLVSEIDATYHELALKLGISDSVMTILYTICDNGESCPLQGICHRSGVSKQTINSAIRKLEAAGIVYLEQASAKSKTVCLTEEGKLFAQQTAIRIITAENEIFASWSKEDVNQYLELTARFLTAIKEKTKNF